MPNCNRYVLVESYSDFLASESVVKSSQRLTFISSNPYLLKYLTLRGLDVLSLEQEGDSSLLTELAAVSGSFAKSLFGALGSFDDVASYGDLFRAHAYVFTTMVSYKERLSLRFFKTLPSNSVIYIPEVKLKLVDALDFSVGRFDNLYSYYFEEIGRELKSVEVIKFTANSDSDVLPFDEAVNGKRLLSISPKVVKLLRSMDYGISELSFSFFLSRGMRKFKPRFSRYSLLIWKRTDILQSGWLKLFFRKKIGVFDLLGLVTPAEHRRLAIESSNKISTKHIAKKANDAWVTTFGLSAENSRALFLSRFLQCMKLSKSYVSVLRTHVDERLSFCSPRVLVLSNMPSSSIELYVTRYMESEGVRFVGFEHGITQGMSSWARYFSEFQPANILKRVVLFWELSATDLKGPRKEIIISGAPNRAVNPRLCKWRRWFLRWYWKLPSKQIVMIAAMPDFNNRIFGPFSSNDLDRFQLLRETIKWSLSKYPDSLIIIKEYPGYRYRDHDDFKDVFELSERIFVAEPELDVSRFAADVLIIFSSQSTLSWACGVKTIRRVFYVEPCSSPGDIVGQPLDAEIPGAERILEVDREYYNQGCAPNKAWSRQLLEYL